MKISYQMMNKFLEQKQYNASVLLYGENFGKVMDFFKKLTSDVDYNDPFSTTVLSFRDVTNNAQLLLDKINTLAFNGTKRLIHITDCGESLPAQIQQIIEQLDYHTTFLIFTCKSTLSTKSTLRSFFEKSSVHATIACYNDDGRDLNAFISNYLQQHNITYSGALVAKLSNLLTGERTATRNELDKLIAYAGKKKNPTEEDTFTCLTNHNPMNNYDICFAFADKNLEQFLLLLGSYRDNLLVIKVLSQYLIRIKQVLMVAHDKREAVMSTFKPPIFFKYIARFKSHLQRWQEDEVIEVLNELLTIEISDKKNNISNIRTMIERMAIQYLLKE